MDTKSQKAAAKAFAEEWEGQGSEKRDCHRFWLGLLRDVFGVEKPEKYIDFEKPVQLEHQSYIDGYIPDTKVLIEQKSIDKDLDKPEPQSDGPDLTPIKQARRYEGMIATSEQPRWIIVCNFREFWIYDEEHRDDPPYKIKLADLPKEYHHLQFLVEEQNEQLQHELEVSVAAGEIVGKLYDALHARYADPDSEYSLHSLNVLCVRLVFCLYAENGGIFGHYAMFHDYMEQFTANQMRSALEELFAILDTPEDKRDKYLAVDKPDLAAFPYVNGGLFSVDEHIEIPPFTDEIRDLLLEQASAGFDWSGISPTIFGAVFESTLNPETRRSGGMHYTSVENIHKVIDPLFLNDLTTEFKEIQQVAVERTRKKKLQDFQKKLASLTFLDPACGSGNFLTETYLSLRRLENEVVSELTHGQITLGDIDFTPIMVSLDQFYGIEINDFAVTVTKTALWIAEAQMMQETEDIVHMSLDFLPLKSYTNIVEGNALRLNWNDVVPSFKLNFIMGNPPFSGYNYQSKEQKEDLKIVAPYVGKNIDYVAGWYFKAAQFIQKTNIRCAFVSTNSISQGEQVAVIWKPLCEEYNVHIDFAHQTFRWDSEANIKAHVHCVIIGFSVAQNNKEKWIYNNYGAIKSNNINPYLLDAPTVFIERRPNPLCDVPPIAKGGMAADGGYLILTKEEKDTLLSQEPQAEEFIRPYMMGDDFMQRTSRFCIWLQNADPTMIKKCPLILKRIEAVKEFRLASKKAATRKKANTPTLFAEVKAFSSRYIAVPLVSSEKRKYVPMDYLNPEVIPGNNLFAVACASLFSFGVMTSNVHMAWMRAVGGRMEMRYRYSASIVYNNFPWPDPTLEQKAKIEETAQGILDARTLYPDSSLTDLYNELTMPPELRKAHQDNDRAVMHAYGFSVKEMTESDCVAELMKLYQKLAEQTVK